MNYTKMSQPDSASHWKKKCLYFAMFLIVVLSIQATYVYLLGQKTIDLYNQKIVILGDSEVGKNNVMQMFRYQKKAIKSREKYKLRGDKDSIYSEYRIDGQDVMVEMSITAGTSTSSVKSDYYKDADSAIVVWDGPDRKSYENGKAWVMTLKKTMHKDFPIIFVLNKTGVDKNKVGQEEVSAWEASQKVYGTHLVHRDGNPKFDLKRGNYTGKFDNWVGGILKKKKAQYRWI